MKFEINYSDEQSISEFFRPLRSSFVPLRCQRIRFQTQTIETRTEVQNCTVCCLARFQFGSVCFCWKMSAFDLFREM